jgi:hypothetical protein
LHRAVFILLKATITEVDHVTTGVVHFRVSEGTVQALPVLPGAVIVAWTTLNSSGVPATLAEAVLVFARDERAGVRSFSAFVVATVLL